MNLTSSGLPVRAMFEHVLVHSKALKKILPAQIDAVISDFDGVFTENKVWVLEDGREAVRCDRGDGLAIGIFRQSTNIPLLVISKEKNPVVQARCDKLKLKCLHGVDDKLPLLKSLAAEHNLSLSNLIYLGNDLNDIECLQAVGCGVAVQDAYPEVKAVADIVLHNPGGQGALRELLWLIMSTNAA